jgi:hypothetical protein
MKTRVITLSEFEREPKVNPIRFFAESIGNSGSLETIDALLEVHGMELDVLCVAEGSIDDVVDPEDGEIYFDLVECWVCAVKKE